MPVTDSYIGRDQAQPSGKRYVHEYHVDGTGKTRRYAYISEPAWDVNAIMSARVAEVNDLLIDEEITAALSDAAQGINPDRVPIEQAQAEFDRRLLAALMQETDMRTLIPGHDFFLAQEARNGANNTARAAALGVTKAEYDLVDARISVMAGIKGAMVSDQEKVWGNLPSEDWR